MKKKPTKNVPKPKDTPATRKRRLQQRLRELNDSNEREMGALMKSISRIKNFRGKRPAAKPGKASGKSGRTS